MSDREEILRLHQRFDDLQKALDGRLRPLEIWQAYQTGRLTALAVFFGVLGTLMVALVGGMIKYFKILAVAFALGCVLMFMTGCAAVHPVSPLVATATVNGHVERAAAYAESAGAAVNKSASSAAEVRLAIAAAQRDAHELQDHSSVAESLRAHLAVAQNMNEETRAAAEAAWVNLQAERGEREKTAVALVALKEGALALERQEAQAVRDKLFAEKRERDIQKDRDQIAGRLNTLAWILAAVAGLLVWSLLSHWTRSVETIAPALSICGPIAGGLMVGGAVFGYLRYFL